ncbi:hypothetical protein BKA91DRAFT_131644 [Yarrowia lipolytica]|uniref:Uncharacterized protein n=1 Tax=Yarrowia lipolytica TaxID=4952 RepID=A0A1D8NP25_YARLL|nr:hypothetical protein YALI1_F24301g [Yarrowia lipolytica]KAB8286431.1 hypothetical protein BKA91DRAFT_131644 [Yarrowia lipolytica]KAE8174330.1 hypothetical protein BKA90DRAFT_134308 [Yarrowia lipolytica]RMJ00341.1 hypothetical protein BD777DRAFT_123160 [Yarrowia lipolytica]
MSDDQPLYEPPSPYEEGSGAETLTNGKSYPSDMPSSSLEQHPSAPNGSLDKDLFSEHSRQLEIDKESPSSQLPSYRRRKRLDIVSDEEKEDVGPPVHRHKLRPTSMAKVLGLNMTELELLRFYFHESSPILCAASGTKDSIWMGNVPALSNRSPALKRAAMTFATLHLGKNRQTATYLLNDGNEHPTSSGPPDMKQVIGYVPLQDRVTERLLIEFTETLRAHKKEIMETEAENCEALLVTSVVIYLVAMSLGPLIPLANFDGGSDLFSIVRNLRLITTTITGQEPVIHPPFEAPAEGSIRLPREEALWEIVELVELNMDYSPITKRRIKGILTKEINSLIQLLNMDILNHSVAHFSAWCTYWQPEFSDLKNNANPYALMIICYYAAYTHMWHILFWWADRSSEDVYYIMDHIPIEFHDYLQWPLEIVQTYEYNYEDMLSGKLREMTLA